MRDPLNRVTALAVLLLTAAPLAACRSATDAAPGRGLRAVGDAEWAAVVEKVRFRDLTDQDGRVVGRLLPPFDHYRGTGSDVVLAIVPDAVASWEPDRRDGAGAIERRRLLAFGGEQHRGFERLLADGIVTARTPDGRRDDELAAVLDDEPERSGVPALVVSPGVAPEAYPAVVVTRDLLVRFRASVFEGPGAAPGDRVRAIVRTWNARVVEEPDDDSRVYVVRAPELDARVWLRTARELAEDPRVTFAHPNLLVHRVRHGAPPPDPDGLGDPLTHLQWHLDLTGARQAWSITRGSPDIVVAVVDPNGVQVKHPDLTANAAGVLHRNFDAPKSAGQAKKSNPQMDKWVGGKHLTAEHGTAAAGLAAGVGDNGIGISGVAPGCRLMGICLGPGLWDDVRAFRYLRKNDVDVVSNSWGYEIGMNVPDAVRCELQRLTSDGRDGKGAVVLFSLTNEQFNNFLGMTPSVDCTGDYPAWRDRLAGQQAQLQQHLADVQAARAAGQTPVWSGFASLPEVMAVGRCTNLSAWGGCGYGYGTSLLGPSHAAVANVQHECGGIAPVMKGTADITTTDLTGQDAGYNDVPGGGKACWCGWMYGTSTATTPLEPADEAYTSCFRGTSAAVPIVAGVAALVLSADPELTYAQVRDVLEGTAVMLPESTPEELAAGYGVTQGHGRVDALAAVTLANQQRLARLPRLVAALDGPTGVELIGDARISYVVVVKNDGGSDDHDVIVEAEVEWQQEYLGCTPPPDADVAVAHGVVPWRVAESPGRTEAPPVSRVLIRGPAVLPAGASRTYRIDVGPRKQGTPVLRVRVRSRGLGEERIDLEQATQQHTTA